METQIKVHKNKKTSNTKEFVVYIKKNMGILIGFVFMCIIFSFLSDRFLSVNNIFNILRQISINAILAFGMTYVILTGGIDLSVGSIVAVTGTVTCGLISKGSSIGTAILVGLIIGAVLGFFNGFVISKTGMPAFIVTLSMMTVARGLAYVYTDGKPIRSLNSKFNFIGNGYVDKIPVPIIIMIIIFIICTMLLNKSKFGRYIYAIGGNREAALFSGINVEKIEMLVYVISGFLSGLSGIILSARMYSGQPTVGQGFELDAIAAVVLGGTSFTGGIGTIGGTIIGALIIGVLNNGLNLIGVPFYYQLILKGLVIVAAVYFDTIKKMNK